jgi:polyisoprenyl-phosphate glycosyltransferase
MKSTVTPAPRSLPRQPQSSDEVLVSVLIVLPHQARQVLGMVEPILETLSKSYDFYELLLVDNSSPFEVQAYVLDLQRRLPNVRLLRLSRRYSSEIAIAAALDHCIGDYVVTMDLADPTDLVPVLVSKATAGFDVVIAERQGAPRTLLERAISVPLYRLASRILGFALHPDESYFRVFSRRLVNSVVRIRSKNRYLSCLNGIVGFQQCSIVYHAEEKGAARRRWGRVLRQLRALTDILVSNSSAPLRLAALLGFLASLANVAYFAYILLVSLVKRHVAEGWRTSSFTQTTMFLMIFLILSILAEYVARLIDETKEQPLYFVEFETTSAAPVQTRDRLNLV